MIPPDMATQLRLFQNSTPQLPTQNQAAPAVTQLSAVLANLTVGQQFSAVVQQQLPNGTYRAVVGQREITLALPFPAKTGDSLELEVVENNGKMMLALLNQKSADSQSVSTTLSRTGQVITELLQKEAGDSAKALALNGSKPIAQNLPPTAVELAQNLKQSLTQSGMFYESHQARWVEGQLPTEALKQEPQAQNAQHNAQAQALQDSKGQALLNQRVADAPHTPQPHAVIPREIVPIVQQQLDALATQQFLWQGQIWQGQTMHWEINEEGKRSNEEVDTREWRTRLTLNLPLLGDIDAHLRLNAQHQLTVLIEGKKENAVALLEQSVEILKNALDAAGLELLQIHIAQEKNAQTS